MPKFIFNVADVWQEPDHIVVISDVPDTEADFRHGDLLELRRPDGKVLQAKGGSILFDPPAERPFAVVFKGLTKEDVPIGTQVWLVSPERPPRKPSRHYEVKQSKERMSKYLCKVADIFQPPGRLVVVADTLYDDFDTNWRHGSTVELRRPDGSSVTTKTWAETGSPTNIGRPMAFSVEDTLTKDDIPPGTEVWLVQEQSSEQKEIEKPEQRRHSA